MCKYCDEIREYDGLISSPELLSEEVSFGRYYGWLFSSYIEYYMNKGPRWIFSIGATDGCGGVNDDRFYIGEFQIQYCPFCGQKFDFKELAE